MRYVHLAGSSTFAGGHLARARAAAARRHCPGLVSEQPRYHLLTRRVELEVLPAARELGIGVATPAERDQFFPPVGTGGSGPEAWAW